MALQCDYQISGVATIYSDGFSADMGAAQYTLKASYVKVERIDASKSDCIANVSIVSGETVIQRRYDFKVELDGINFIAQAYEHLKTLPEFEGAEDC